MPSLTVFIQAVLQQWTWLPGMLGLLVKGSLLLMLAWALSFLIRRQAAGYRHLVWFSVLLILLFLPVLTGHVPTLEIRVPEDSLWLVTRVSGQVTGADGTDATLLGMAGNALLWTSLVMTTAFLLHTLLGILSMAGISRRAFDPQLAMAREELLCLLAREGMTHKVSLLFSPEIDSPLSWGFFRPVILCPLSADNWTREKWHSVLAHELCHIERCDWLSLLLGKVVLALYWYNPLVWLALHKMNEEAELACDDAVVLEQDNADYASALVSLAREHNTRFGRHGLAKAMANSFLGRRVVSVLDGRLVRIRSENLFLIRAALFGLSLGAVVASVGFVPQENGETATLQLNSQVMAPGPRDENLLRSSLSPFTATGRPDRSVFDDMPDLPRISTVVPRPNIPDYLQTFVPNAQGNTPGFVLEELGAIADSGPSRLLLSQGVPVYPESAKRGNVSGYVVVEFEIRRDGTVGKARVIDSAPARIFDRSALEAIYRNRYTPQLNNHHEAPAVIQQTRYIFQLQPEPG